MKKFIYLLTLSLGLTCIIQAAQISVTQQEISVADNAAFKSMFAIIRDLQLSTEARYKQVAELLEEHPQIVNAHNTAGYTALMLAASYGRTEIAKLLITAGANVNAQNSAGWTALISAAIHGRTEIAKLLITAGADFNARDGRTALMLAAIHGRTEIVQLLITAGADPDIQNDKDGKTARYYAHDIAAYDAAVQAGLAEKARKTRRERYKKDQAAAKTIIAQEVTHVTPLVDMISAYAYDPKNTYDLPEPQEETLEIKENSENDAVKTAVPQKKSLCVVQ